MAIRSFAAGVLAGLIIPAVIVTVFIVADSEGSNRLAPGGNPTGATATAGANPSSSAPNSTTTPDTSTTDPSGYQSESVEVPAGRLLYVTFNVPDRYTLDGYFLVSGGQGDISFWATGRDGEDILDKERIKERGDFELNATTGGSYTLYFDNSESTTTARQIIIYYRLRAT